MFGREKKAVTERLSLFSPAKINAFFRVLYKREDGFHEIASLYQSISLGDDLDISISDKDHFSCTESSLLGEDNLVLRSLALFRKKTGCSHSFSVHLNKKIPIQAGLGGGSSNAATALFGFMKLAQLTIPKQTLVSWASELGSDVPFFFSCGTAYATGRGEILQDVKLCVRPSFWIVKPKMGLSTPKVYAECNPNSFLPRDPQKSLQDVVSSFSGFYNDLEGPAFSICPELSKIKNHLLLSGFHTVVLCGSGTAFFCIGSLSHLDFLQQMPGLDIFPVTTLQRKEHSWYDRGGDDG